MTTSYASRPPPSATGSFAHSSARAVMARALVSSAAWASRDATAVLRPADSTRSTCTSGSATASARPGKPAPEPTSAIRRARLTSRTDNRGEGIGQVAVDGVGNGRVRVRLSRERLEQALELPRGRLREAEPAAQLLERFP